jgi:ketosteroid isomerase-like protein
MRDLAFTILEVHSSRDLAVEVGKADFKMQTADQAESSSQTVKYVVVWKRQTDGAWKLFRDIWNSMPPAPK